MKELTIRVLVVEDYEPFRRFLCSTIEKRQDIQIVGEACDGLVALQKAQELKPDLILLDIGLPELNGIEVARRIRERLPNCKILFLTEHRSRDVVEAALSTGATGYVVKSDAGAELLLSVEAALQDKRFLSSSLAGHAQGVRRHHVGFYRDDEHLLDDLVQFIGSALQNGNGAIVVATPSHRDSLLATLQMNGLNVGTAIEQGTYIALDAADTLAALMINGTPDPVRFLKLLGGLILTTAEAARARSGNGHVAIFGECVNLLCNQGKEDAAIEFEKLGNQLLNTYDVEILCGYSLCSLPGEMQESTFARICAQHSGIYESQGIRASLP
ncbi:MAG TPA: response regulator [Terriglobales bacterium]|nr:response regulator [Terriglobales bacterium]